MRARDLVRFGLKAGQTWFGRLRSPYKVTFSVTNKCNLRCAWCNIWAQPAEGELTASEIDRFFRKSREIRWLDLTGGEVMLRHDFADITRSAADHLHRLFQFHFPTNGTFPERTEKSVRLATSLPIPKVVVSVSMDGPQELHDTLRGKPGTWDAAVETYERIKAIPRADVYFGILFDTVAVLGERIPGFSPRDLHLNIAHKTFYYGNPDVSFAEPEDLTAALSAFTQQRGTPRSPILLLEWLYQRKVPEYLQTGQSPLPCEALSSSLFVASNGDLFPCTSYEHLLGNLRDLDFDLRAFWARESIRRLSREIKNNQCPGCWTPCEAYQTIIASLAKPTTWRSSRHAHDRIAR
jgi:MoaA/NifB/PqqE/SkfB family radical SAM enzyme